MYLSGEIQVLVATATLAWGVNLPARLVIVKGTEYYDGKSSRYVDYPLTDVLQMIGRAGRPGFDTLGSAVVMVEESKKNFYKVRWMFVGNGWHDCDALFLTLEIRNSCIHRFPWNPAYRGVFVKISMLKLHQELSRPSSTALGTSTGPFLPDE